MRIALILLLSMPLSINAQSNPLSVFDNLINKSWQAVGKWGDGSLFNQEIRYEYSLDSNIVIAKTKGFVDQKKQKFGERNHGIRKYNATSSQFEFWEFDVFGGATNGTIQFENKDFLYQYNYGGTFLTEMWKYINDTTYQYIIGEYSSGKWDETYLSTQFVGTRISNNALMYENLKERIIGSWWSKAWDGKLNEQWSENENGEITQRAEYIENGKLLYSASNKIELIGDELILFTVIKDGSPKIFQASSFTKDQIIFENEDYKNPSKVIYNFGLDEGFRRTISGMENGKPTSYTFNFRKVE